MGVVVRNLYNINGRWKYRKVIPQSLRPHIEGNLTEFVRWLGAGPKDNPDLIRRHGAAVEECANLFLIAKKRLDGVFDKLTPDVIAHLIGTARSNLPWEDDEDRFDVEADELFAKVATSAGVVVNDDTPDRKWAKRQESLEFFLADCRYEFARGSISPFHVSEIEDICASAGLYVDTASLDFRRLAKVYLAMQIEVTEAKLRRQEGAVVPTPEAPIKVAAPQAASESLTLRKLAEKKLTMKNKSEATTQATETALRLFESVYGDRPITSIERREVAEWIFLLQKKPIFPAKDDRHLGLRDLVTAYDTRKDVQRLSGKSVNGHVSHLNSIWAWGRQRGFIDRLLDNPFSEQRVDERPPEADEGFTPAQLQAIFDLPIFTRGEQPKGGRGQSQQLPLRR